MWFAIGVAISCVVVSMPFPPDAGTEFTNWDFILPRKLQRILSSSARMNQGLWQGYASPPPPKKYPTWLGYPLPCWPPSQVQIFVHQLTSEWRSYPPPFNNDRHSGAQRNVSTLAEFFIHCSNIHTRLSKRSSQETTPLRTRFSCEIQNENKHTELLPAKPALRGPPWTAGLPVVVLVLLRSSQAENELLLNTTSCWFGTSGPPEGRQGWVTAPTSYNNILRVSRHRAAIGIADDGTVQTGLVYPPTNSIRLLRAQNRHCYDDHTK